MGCESGRAWFEVKSLLKVVLKRNHSALESTKITSRERLRMSFAMHGIRTRKALWGGCSPNCEGGTFTQECAGQLWQCAVPCADWGGQKAVQHVLAVIRGGSLFHCDSCPVCSIVALAWPYPAFAMWCIKASLIKSMDEAININL